MNRVMGWKLMMQRLQHALMMMRKVRTLLLERSRKMMMMMGQMMMGRKRTSGIDENFLRRSGFRCGDGRGTSETQIQTPGGVDGRGQAGVQSASWRVGGRRNVQMLLRLRSGRGCSHSLRCCSLNANLSSLRGKSR